MRRSCSLSWMNLLWFSNCRSWISIAATFFVRLLSSSESAARSAVNSAGALNFAEASRSSTSALRRRIPGAFSWVSQLYGVLTLLNLTFDFFTIFQNVLYDRGCIGRAPPSLASESSDEEPEKSGSLSELLPTLLI